MRIKYRFRSHVLSLLSFETSPTHRFASHICQTKFTVAKDMVSRKVSPIVFEPIWSLTAFRFIKARGILPVL